MKILEVRNLKKYFPVTGGVFSRRTGWVHALDDVSFSLNRGETLGIVGESGCGKTTLGRCIMGLYTPTDGNVFIKGKDVSALNSDERKALALNLQIIFQDPYESLNPRQTVKQILEEKYAIHRKKNKTRSQEILKLLERVGLQRDSLSRFPHEFSGGQRQRIGIARAISLSPDILVCDEPVSALDVSVQSKILNLLLALQKKMALTYIFISHDLSVVKHVSDRIAVMYMGRIVEMAAAEQIYQNAMHPYTNALLSSIPKPEVNAKKQRIILKGEVPSVETPPSGCRFHTRCSHTQKICKTNQPELIKHSEEKDHITACHFFH